MIAPLIINIARTLRDQDQPAEAEKLGREALGILRGCRPSKRVKGSLAQACQVVGMLAWNQGNHGEEPIALLREGVKLRREVFGPETPMVAETLHYLAWCCNQAGRTEEAIAAYEEALQIARIRHHAPNWQKGD